jgi:hypothetical protein
MDLPDLTPFKGYLVAAVAAVLVLGSGFIGYRLGDAKVDRVLNKLNNNKLIEIQKAATISQAVGTKTQAAEVQIRTVTQTIHDQVPVYVPLKSSCDVPAGFVRVFNASAQGIPLPDAPAEPNDAPSGVALATVADVTNTDFGICHETANRLTGLQSWVSQQQALAAKGK